MTGSTIDHLISLTVFIGALLVFISLFNQTLQTAILYQRQRYLATKCNDLLDNIMLNPGIPSDWGESGNVPIGFGLQDPKFTHYALSPFSLMRLLSFAGNRAYYNGTWYSNVSWGVNGGYLFLRESECVSYDLASKLLGTNGTYGFRLTIMPTVNVTIVEDQSAADHLRLNITVIGQNSPLAGASIKYLLYRISASIPNFVNFTTGMASTDALGFASLEFHNMNVSQNKMAYVFIARVSAGGLYGVGYLARNAVTNAGTIVPYVENSNGTILLVHNPVDSNAALHFNASFYVLSSNFQIANGGVLNITSGPWLVNYGDGKPSFVLQIQPPNNGGFLVVSYWKEDGKNECGMVVVPWGIGIIGLSIVFGGDSAGQGWVATDIRQVAVRGIAYQARLALWSLESYEMMG